MDVWTKALAGITARLVLILTCSSGTRGEEVCDSQLVSNLPPSSFLSSSHLSSSHAPGFAKLNRRDGAGGWSPLVSDRYQWLQVDLGERRRITAIATQGRYGSSDWLTSYLLMFSDTGHNWRQYRQEDGIGFFPGNSNADSVVQYKLQQPAVARFLRLLPLDWNPNGRIGLRLESYGCPYTSDVVSLDGSSALVIRLSPGTRQTSKDVVSLKFKTRRNRGTLLHVEGSDGLGLSLELDRGKLLLLLKRGGVPSPESRRLASLGSLLDNQQWHHVILEQRNSQLNLTVDKHAERFQIPEAFGLWDVKQLSVGRAPGLGSQKPAVRDFHGCLENLQINDLNLIEMAKHNDRKVTVKGNVTFSCLESVSIAVTFPGPSSFLQLPRTSSTPTQGFSIGFQFRTWNEAGLFVHLDLVRPDGVLWLYLSDATLRLEIREGDGKLLELRAGSDLNDGQWRSVDVSFKLGLLTLAVDNESVANANPSFPVNTGSLIFFGGCPADGDAPECRNPFGAFQGCMRRITMEQQPVDLMMVQQRLLGNYSRLHVDMCGMIDRCSPSHCEHGGGCSQSWSSFYCNCSGSGYSGATCHSSAFQRSCEAYKHNGNTSGHFYIDVDGSGPIRPQLVYCNMTEEKTWMVMQHNNTELTRVRASKAGSHLSVHFGYPSQEEQLLAAISQSDHCEQQLSYRCRRSRLLNALEGSPFSWWLGGPGRGRVQTYWGGAQPGSQQCSCGLQGDCVDPQHYCNCDADRDQWTEDSGPLTHKDSLPVRSLVLGDIHRPGSEAAYRVGPLRCHGDRNLWNAAFFDKETSYLHFPTFLHAELSADISFLFKTTASSGVFLENLGIKDFIRIELSSSTRVLFSFDVGNGPLEVHVESSVPLNDERWHRIRAERNIKEASLRLDDLPVSSQEAPLDGHFHLQLNSQLFIGGTASRQKGFRGCIRSLQLNGVTLDLEERARITPGVRAGCPGHCSSYGSLCQNQGRCVERENGFHCDCSLSAYAGIFCQSELSAIFKSGTSVSYTFKDPSRWSRNGSSVPSSIYSELTLREENVSVSFRTSQSPALLLYVGSSSREYLALLINKHDKLEVRYKLDSSREAEVLRSGVSGLANGQLHTLTVRRRSDSVSLQIDQNIREDFNLTSDGEFNGIKELVLGQIHESEVLDAELSWLASLRFTGCLSLVRFNAISPLKAALLQPDSSPVTISGPLVKSTCGSTASANPHAPENTHTLSDRSDSEGSGQPLVNAMRTDSALVGGIIAVVIFVVVGGLAIAARCFYSRKETYRNHEEKAVQQDDSQEFSFNNQADSHHVSEHPKEFFM